MLSQRRQILYFLTHFPSRSLKLFKMAIFCSLNWFPGQDKSFGKLPVPNFPFKRNSLVLRLGTFPAWCFELLRKQLMSPMCNLKSYCQGILSLPWPCLVVWLGLKAFCTLFRMQINYQHAILTLSQLMIFLLRFRFTAIDYVTLAPCISLFIPKCHVRKFCMKKKNPLLIAITGVQCDGCVEKTP